MSWKPRLLRFKFDDFENIPSDPGNKTISETVTCNGNNWLLVLYPGGKASASAEGGNAEGMMSIYLRNVAGGDVIAGYTFIIRGAWK